MSRREGSLGKGLKGLFRMLKGSRGSEGLEAGVWVPATLGPVREWPELRRTGPQCQVTSGELWEGASARV